SAQAQVDDVHAVLDGPAQARREDHGLARESPPQDAHAVELVARSQAADDPRAGGPVADQVLVRSLDDPGLRLGALVVLDHDAPGDGPHGRMARLDPAVHYRHLDPRPGAVPERPLALDRGRDVERADGVELVAVELL